MGEKCDSYCHLMKSYDISKLYQNLKWNSPSLNYENDKFSKLRHGIFYFFLFFSRVAPNGEGVAAKMGLSNFREPKIGHPP